MRLRHVLLGFGLWMTACNDPAVPAPDAGRDLGIADLGSDQGTPDQGTPDQGTPDQGTLPDLGGSDGGVDLGLSDDAGADAGVDLGPTDLGVDPCADCASGTTCDTTGASAVCVCPAGYAGDGTTAGTGCSDVDECMSGAASCDPNATCTNSAGGYACACDAGYEGDGLQCSVVGDCANGGVTCGTNANCEATPTGSRCVCAVGFVGDGVACTDVDECATGASACDAIATCGNTAGGYTCSCPGGYTGDGFTCSDVNECAGPVSPCGADAVCTNTAGSHTCACAPGFVGDGRVCDDVDECTLATDDCDAIATCTNTAGGFDCSCPTGYDGDGTSCIDVDECALDLDGCDVNADCTNTAGSYGCTCRAGYVGDGRTCTVIVDCTTADVCAPEATCVTTTGGSTCVCAAGYVGDGTSCTDVNECTLGTDDCDPLAYCTNTTGGFTCACPSGYLGDGTSCADIDECALDLDGCASVATCTNEPGGFRCACPNGYAGDGTVCTDIDECALDLDDCDENAACTDAPGGFTCACQAPSTGDGTTCACPRGTTGVGCTYPMDCVAVLTTGAGRTSGLYTVDPDGSRGPVPPTTVYCDMTYQGGGWTLLLASTTGGPDATPTTTPSDAAFGILPVDVAMALAAGSDTVHIRTRGMPDDSVTSRPGTTPIVNLRRGAALYTSPAQYAAAHWTGSRVASLPFSCSPSPEGYPRTVYHACNNGTGLHLLGDQSRWSLTEPAVPLELYVRHDPCGPCGAQSTCAFEGTSFACVDVDECALGTDACAANATCSNLAPGYDCTCPPGYAGDGFTCADVDECGTDTDACDPNATCANTEGSYTCTCDAGYAGDGRTCSPLVDCVTQPSLCGANATCVVGAPGASYCACDVGYRGDGSTCTDVDECAEATDDCDVNADCGNTAGGFTCTCGVGYRGDGRTCTDIDECTEASDDCAANATCTNLAGGFECACDAPSTGDGRSCVCPAGLVGARCEIATTCVAVRRFGLGSASGVYTLDVDGDGPLDPTDVYCDMEYEGGGWALIIAGGPGGTSTLSETTPTPIAHGYLPTAVARALAANAEVVHLRTAGAPYDSITSTVGSAPIQNLRAGSSLYTSPTQYQPWDWTGPHAGDTWFNCPPYMGAYPANIIESCGNITGVTWTPTSTQWSYSGPQVSLELYVRETPCGTSCTPLQVCGFDGDDFACLDRNECALDVDTCDPLAVCTNTTDGAGFTCACTPPATGDGTTCTCPAGLAGPGCAIATTCVGVLKRDGATPSGVVSVDPDGTGPMGATDVYCDTVTDGGGWMLVASAGTSGLDASTIGVPLPGEDEYQPTAVMRALAASSERVRINTRGNLADHVTSTRNSLPIENYRAGIAAYTNPGEFDWAHWTGPRIGNLWFGCGGGATYPSTVYWACGNSNGLHFVSSTTQWDLGQAAVPMEFWMREEPCGAGCATGSTCSLVGRAFQCIDQNECLLGTDDCATEATCTNTLGGFTCACPSGYTGDGRTCTDVDECSTLPDPCPVGTCSNTPGGFDCN